MRCERHWIRDTNHTAADQPCAASKQGNRDAETTISNSSLKCDHRQHGGDESTSEHAHMMFGFSSRRRKKNCRRYRQRMVSFRQKHVELRRTEVMNKTVHQSSNHCNWILSLALMNLFPNVFVTSLTLETRVLFETRIGCEELPTMMFQQIVFSFRETARVTRCHKQFSTTTFLLSSEITQLNRRPAGTLCRPSPINVSTKLQDCCRVLEKLSQNLSGSKTATCRIVLMRNYWW